MTKTFKDIFNQMKPISRDDVQSQANRSKTAELESQGWEVWLKTIFPFAFPKPFAPFHRVFWDLWWDVCLCIRDKKPIDQDKLTIMLLFGRALAKSSTGTPATLMKGAIVGHIYSLYISEIFDQACEHLDNVRYLITHPESRLTEFYPHLELNPQGAKELGFKGKDSEGLFITVGKCAFRAFGVDGSPRGIGLFGKRPDDYNIDDVDNINHSIAVSMKLIQKITRNFLMTQDLIGDIPVTTKVLQNLIIEHGFVNQVYTRKTDALSKRTVIGVVNTFEKLEIESQVTAKGIEHKILPSSIPSWEAVSIPVAQKILDLLGYEGFMAECQNNFEALKDAKVFPLFDEDLHIITWSDFEKVFGCREIPLHWKRGIGHDLGFTKEHASAWSFIAKSAMNSKLPNKYFLYRGLSFHQVMSDEQADKVNAILEKTKERPNIQVWRMSHERLNERMTYNVKYKMPFSACNSSKEAGIAEGNHLFRANKKIPHPFRDDEEKMPDGLYKFGCPSFFWIVADDQRAFPKNDDGLILHRQEISNYRRVPIKITDLGLTEEKPAKIFDDAMDSMKMVLDAYSLLAVPMTEAEKVEVLLPTHLTQNAIQEVIDNKPELTNATMLARDYAVNQTKARLKKQNEEKLAKLKQALNGFKKR